MPDDLSVAEPSGLAEARRAVANAQLKRVPKYRNTDNPAETWMGRGKRPNWLKAQLSAGRRLEEFRIQE
jgi:DNA-binding protein H-NS